MMAKNPRPDFRNRLRRLVGRPIRNVLRNPRATANWLMRETRFYLGHVAVCQVRDDWQVRCHPCSLENFEAHRNHEDCRQELEGLIAHCTSEMIFYDIGAHYGSMTLAAFRYGGPGTRAVAVDPSPTANRILKINLGLAGLGERTQIVQAAIGKEDGRMPMLTSGPGGAHFWIGVDAVRPDVRYSPQVTLSTLVRRTGLLPSHIKIDVEGFEDEVLSGGQDLFADLTPVLFLEVHGRILRARQKNPETILQRLREWGYRRFERYGRPLRPQEVANGDVLRLVCSPR